MRGRTNLRECGNCGSTDALTVHHVVPRALGGTERDTNKVVLCWPCHAKVHNFGSGYVEAQRRGYERAKAEGRTIRPSKRTAEIIEKVKIGHGDGKSIRQLQDELGLCHTTVYRAARDAGIVIQRKLLTDHDKNKIRALLLKGLPTRTVAKKVGFSQKAVQDLRKDLDKSVLLRSGGQPGKKLSSEHKAKISSALQSLYASGKRERTPWAAIASRKAKKNQIGLL